MQFTLHNEARQALRTEGSGLRYEYCAGAPEL